MEELVDTRLIKPYDDYENDDIYVKPIKKKYGINNFFVGELKFNPNSKNFNGYTYKIESNNLKYNTILSCFYKIKRDTYYCLFDGKIYNTSDIKNLSEMKNFIPLYATNINVNITFDEAIKLFNTILRGNRKFKISDDVYNIRNFYCGDLYLKTFSEEREELEFNNIINHILLKKSKSIYDESKSTDSVDVYKTIFYTDSKSLLTAYCLNDSQVYENVLDSSKIKNRDKIVSNLVSLRDLLKELDIECSKNFVGVKEVLEFQKKLYKKRSKIE